MESAINPNTAFDFNPDALACDLKRFETDYKCGNDFASLGGKNRDRDNFIDRLVRKIDIFGEVTDLLRIWQSFESQLRLGFRVKLSNILRI